MSANEEIEITHVAVKLWSSYPEKKKPEGIGEDWVAKSAYIMPEIIKEPKFGLVEIEPAEIDSTGLIIEDAKYRREIVESGEYKPVTKLPAEYPKKDGWLLMTLDELHAYNEERKDAMSTYAQAEKQKKANRKMVVQAMRDKQKAATEKKGKKRKAK